MDRGDVSPKTDSILMHDKDKASQKEDEPSGVVQMRIDGRGVDDVESAEPVREVDGVFGEQGDGKDMINYRSVGWVSTSILLMKTQIGLGVLAIPSVFHTLGLAPGIIILVVIGALTTYCDWYIGMFKLKHPQVYSMSDCGQIMFGRIGAEIFGIGYWLLMAFVSGSAFLALSTGLNAISLHGTCTAVFVAVAAIVTLPLASLRRLERIKWISWVGLVSILASVLIVTIAVGAGSRPALAPQEGPVDLGIVIWGKPNFADAMNAVANILLSYAGTSAFLPIASEMREPRHFPKAVVACQAFATAFYIAVGTVMYLYAGQYVTSPALGTAGVLIKRIAYGISLPGLLAAAVIFTHLSAKWIFVRALRNSHHLTHSTKTHWVAWLSCTGGCVIFAYVVASAIPVFNGLVGLIGAFFGSFFCLSAVSFMWFYDNWYRYRILEKRTTVFWSLVTLNAFIVVAGFFIMVGGTYGSIVAIINGYTGGRPWSCEDNSGSV